MPVKKKSVAKTESKKSDSVNDLRIKTQYIKKALNMSLNAIEYLPDDVEMRYKIIELEKHLTII